MLYVIIVTLILVNSYTKVDEYVSNRYLSKNKYNILELSFIAILILLYINIISLFAQQILNSLIIQILLTIYILNHVIFSYKPKKSREIYNYVFAHRGFHLNVPENSYSAYKLMVGKFGIEMDVRYLKDGTIICFHDRYTKRLLGVPGRTNKFTYNKIRKFKFKGSKYRVIRLKSALELINGKSPVLIEVKGFLSKIYSQNLQKIIKSYNGVIYFHCKNIFTYVKLRKLYGDKVFWVLNPFRKRFNFLKGKHYNNQLERFIDLFEEASIEIPSIEDISQILVEAFEENESVKEIVATISGVCNNYKSRVNENHFLTNSLILHRGILSDRFVEHSKGAFEACVRFAEFTNTCTTIELDLVYYNSKVICYHSDKVSDKLGQAKSCAEKSNISDSITLEEILDIVKGHEDLVSIIFDIKDSNIKNRILEKEFIRIIEEKKYTGNFAVQAWNPLVLMYFEKVRPDFVRGQVGHSLSGLIKYVPINQLPWIVNVLLFNKSHADYCVYDASNFIYILIKYNRNIKGRPVFIYAPKTELEIESFIGKEQIAGFIVENVIDNRAWSKSYIRKFKKR